LTKNEERHIKKCIESIKWADDFSGGATADIAKKKWDVKLCKIDLNTSIDREILLCHNALMNGLYVLTLTKE